MSKMFGWPDELKVKLDIHPKRRPKIDEMGKILRWFRKMGVWGEKKGLVESSLPVGKVGKWRSCCFVRVAAGWTIDGKILQF